MKDHVADPKFQIKRQIEMALEKEFPEAYFSKYSLVTFNEKIGYAEAMALVRCQDKILLEYIKNNHITPPFDLEEILKVLKLELTNLEMYVNY